MPEPDIAALKAYLTAGGTLIADDCGGSGAFSASFAEVLQTMFPDHPLTQIPPDHPLYQGAFPDGAKIKTVAYRKFAVLKLGPTTAAPLRHRTQRSPRRHLLQRRPHLRPPRHQHLGHPRLHPRLRRKPRPQYPPLHRPEPEEIARAANLARPCTLGVHAGQGRSLAPPVRKAVRARSSHFTRSCIQPLLQRHQVPAPGKPRMRPPIPESVARTSRRLLGAANAAAFSSPGRKPGVLRTAKTCAATRRLVRSVAAEVSRSATHSSCNILFSVRGRRVRSSAAILARLSRDHSARHASAQSADPCLARVRLSYAAAAATPP